MSAKSPVERYYDRNTRSFLRFGGGESSGAIHRQLWGPGVDTVEQASRYINQLLADAIAAMPDSAVSAILDLGCGVGGTAVQLAGRFPAVRVHGITLSATQVELAEHASERRGVADRCVFHRGDFDEVRLGVEVDVAFAVEAFVHSQTPAQFFATACAHIRSGGSLIIVDDFRVAAPAESTPMADRLSEDFRRGWRANSVMSVSACCEFAAAAGFTLTEQHDLTPLIRLNRPRDRLIASLAPLCRGLGLVKVPFFGNLIGGNALHSGLRAGHFSYRWLSFRRTSA